MMSRNIGFAQKAKIAGSKEVSKIDLHFDRDLPGRRVNGANGFVPVYCRHFRPCKRGLRESREKRFPSIREAERKYALLTFIHILLPVLVEFRRSFSALNCDPVFERFAPILDLLGSAFSFQ
ncbi:hypothetical protein TNCV_1091651 [Trichonephila clavipes]|nr:hypothetical protein TNCV_1091651 [Trichonephila clavipes]